MFLMYTPVHCILTFVRTLCVSTTVCRILYKRKATWELWLIHPIFRDVGERRLGVVCLSGGSDRPLIWYQSRRFTLIQGRLRSMQNDSQWLEVMHQKQLHQCFSRIHYLVHLHATTGAVINPANTTNEDAPAQVSPLKVCLLWVKS